jgi:2-polyprenyl-6-methoxyphenol hydroxylase-like FAD-dependent oxidoreductase
VRRAADAAGGFVYQRHPSAVATLVQLQWVNNGFAAMFGKGCPMDSDNEAFITKLAQTSPAPDKKPDPYAELRQALFNSFRPKVKSPPVWPRPWPWIYGGLWCPVGSFWRRWVAKLACGDAAVCFDPISGQGIFSALYGGMMAGRAISDTLNGAKARLNEYSKRLENVRRLYVARSRAIYRSELAGSLNPSGRSLARKSSYRRCVYLMGA